MLNFIGHVELLSLSLFVKKGKKKEKHHIRLLLAFPYFFLVFKLKIKIKEEKCLKTVLLRIGSWLPKAGQNTQHLLAFRGNYVRNSLKQKANVLIKDYPINSTVVIDRWRYCSHARRVVYNIGVFAAPNRCRHCSTAVTFPTSTFFCILKKNCI